MRRGVSMQLASGVMEGLWQHSNYVSKIGTRYRPLTAKYVNLIHVRLTCMFYAVLYILFTKSIILSFYCNKKLPILIFIQYKQHKMYLELTDSIYKSIYMVSPHQTLLNMLRDLTSSHFGLSIWRNTWAH